MSRLSRPTPHLLVMAGALGALALFGAPAAAAHASTRPAQGCTTAAPYRSTSFACLQRLGIGSSSARIHAAQASADPAPPYTVVATGLDNPRGLAFGPGGSLYVAEAGSGGNGSCVMSPEGGLACYGPSGAVLRIGDPSSSAPTTATVAGGLPSLASPGGVAADGPADVAFAPGDPNPYAIVQSIGLTPTETPLTPTGVLGSDGALLGTLLRLDGMGGVTVADNISQYQAGHERRVGPPDAEPLDSDPYSVAIDPATGVKYIADAAANNVVQVNADGTISTTAEFADRPIPGCTTPSPANNFCQYQPVPDSVTVGPDGAIYVGELGGGGAPVGSERVYRIVPGATTNVSPTVYLDGFTSISALAFGPDGSLYVLEIFEHGLDAVFGNPNPGPSDVTGALIRVAPDGSRTTIASGLSGGLFASTGLAISLDGKYAYVSNFGICPATGGGPCPPTGGEVVRISLASTGPGPGPTPTPELGSGELLAAGLAPIAAALLYRRRRRATRPHEGERERA